MNQVITKNNMTDNTEYQKRVTQRRKDSSDAAFDGICQNIIEGNEKILPFFKKERITSYNKIILRIKEMQKNIPEYKDVKVKGIDF